VPTTDESYVLFKVVIDYTYGLDTLNDYDYHCKRKEDAP